MLLPGARGQQQRDLLYDFSGTIATGGTTQLLLPERKSTSFLFVQNISDYQMFIKFGSAKAHAVLTSGVVTSVVVDDAGFGFTLAPTVQFLGGGGIGWNFNDGLNTGSTAPQSICPNNFATAQANMASATPLGGLKVNSITVLNGGANYLQAPYVFIANNYNDPMGCGTASGTSGVSLSAVNGSWTSNGTMCPTEPISIYCATSAAPFTCYWSP
jgi:hypothetical protein